MASKNTEIAVVEPPVDNFAAGTEHLNEAVALFAKSGHHQLVSSLIRALRKYGGGAA